MPSKINTPVEITRAEPFLFYLTIGFIGLIVYGSLYPFSDWTYPDTPLFSFLTARWFYEIPDLIQNFLVYAPFGLLLMLQLKHTDRLLPSLCKASCIGLILSFGVESIQQFLPSRVSSVSDLLMNLIGTACGGLLVVMTDQRTSPGQILTKYRHEWIRPEASSNIGLLVLSVWVLSQTSPLVPSFDPAHFLHGFSLIKSTYEHPEQFQLARMFSYSCNILALGLLFLNIAQKNKLLIRFFALAVMCVLFSKLIIVGRLLSLEAICGGISGLILLTIFAKLSIRSKLLLASVAILLGFFAFEFTSAEGQIFYPFNWIPLTGQMLSLSGLEDMLGFLWPFMALAYFVRIQIPSYKETEYAFFGGTAILVSVFIAEWSQQFLPGRFGDISQIGLALIGWTVIWYFPIEEQKLHVE